MSSVAVVSPTDNDDSRPSPITSHYRPLSSFQMLDQHNLITPSLHQFSLNHSVNKTQTNYFQQTQNFHSTKSNKPTHRRTRSQPVHLLQIENQPILSSTFEHLDDFTQQQQLSFPQKQKDVQKSSTNPLPKKPFIKKSIQKQLPTLEIPKPSAVKNTTFFSSSLPPSASPPPPTPQSQVQQSPQIPTQAPFSSALDALIVVAVAEHVDSTQSCTIRHLCSPNHSNDHNLVTTARAAIQESHAFIFPSDIPTLPSSSSNSMSDDFPHSPISEDDQTDQSSPISTELDSARVLPVSSHELFDALNESHSEPSIGAISAFKQSQHTETDEDTTPRKQKHRRKSNLMSRTSIASKTIHTNLDQAANEMETHKVRRVNSLPRRPSSSPNPRLRSLGLPAYTPALSIEERSERRKAKAATVAQHRLTKHILRCATVHVFTRTAQDGSRQYVFCRPLSSTHALVVISSSPLTAAFSVVMERTASKYSALLDRVIDENHSSSISNDSEKKSTTSKESRFLMEDLLRCPPKVARGLCRAVLEGLRKHGPSSSRSTPPRFRKPWMSSEYLTTSMDAEGDSDVDIPTPVEQDIGAQIGRNPSVSTDNSSSILLSSSTTSSGVSTPIKGTHQLPRVLQRSSLQDSGSYDTDLKNGPKKDRSRTARTSSSLQNSRNASTNSLPWNVASNSADSQDMMLTRVLELADASVLLHHLSVRAIISLIVALLEERRICLMGPTTAIVSRSVIALENLMRPFAYPHSMSPILITPTLPYLGAPFPYLFGILNSDFEEAKKLPLDEVVFGDLKTGKVFTTNDLGDMYKRMPRRLRTRLERRLTRVKAACTRQMAQTLGSSSLGASAAVFFNSNYFESASERQPRPGSILWRIKSQHKSEAETLPTRNVWLEYDTIVSLDKAMRKFFAELMEDLSAVRAENEKTSANTGQSRPEGNNWKSNHSSASAVTFTSTKRDAERRQLIKAFIMTQMFMLWEEEEDHDVRFGIKQEPSALRKKKSVNNLNSPAPEQSKESTKSKLRKKAEDIYANTRGVLSDTEVFVNMKNDDRAAAMNSSGKIQNERKNKRFRNKKKVKRNQRWRNQTVTENEQFGFDDRVLQSDTETSSRSRPMDFEYMEDFVHQHRRTSLECVPDTDAEPIPSKRLWLPLRLRPNAWSVGHDLNALGNLAEHDEFMRANHLDVCDGCSTDGNDSDDIGEEAVQKGSKDALPSDESNVGWGRMRYWHKRRMRPSHRN